MNARTVLITLLVGITLGAAGAILLPPQIRPYLPAAIAGTQPTVAGTVVAKQRKDKALLLTVNTAEGAVLVTIRKNVDGVDLLIGETDTVEFSLKQYSPFVDDPRIARVLKKDPTTAARPSAAPKEEKAAAPRSAQERQKAVQPAPAGSSPQPKAETVSPDPAANSPAVPAR